MLNLEYQLEFEARNTYLYARLSGKDSFAAGLSYWNEIKDKVEETGAKKLLVHEALEGEVTEEEMYDLMVDLVRHGFPEVRVAFFDENLDDKAINHLGKMVAESRGANNVRIFESLPDAQYWIEHTND
jgi:hypothetical protein